MAGEIVKKSDYDSTSTAIDNARAKWGLGRAGSTVAVGETTTAAKINSLVDLVTQAKSKSGWGGSITGKVSVAEYLKKQKLTELTSNANSIYSYCPCNGNCSGSCSGSCRGCSGRCGGSGNCCGSCGSQPGH